MRLTRFYWVLLGFTGLYLESLVVCCCCSCSACGSTTLSGRWLRLRSEHGERGGGTEHDDELDDELEDDDDTDELSPALSNNNNNKTKPVRSFSKLAYFFYGRTTIDKIPKKENERYRRPSSLP